MSAVEGGTRTSDEWDRTIRTAVEAANLHAGRAVTSQEILEALSVQEQNDLLEAYSRAPSAQCSRFLRRLEARGRVQRAGKQGRNVLWVVTPLAAKLNVGSNRTTSGRQAVRELLRRAVMARGRALVMREIHQVAEEEGGELDSETVSRSVHSLVRTGEVSVVDKIRGDGGGDNLYLPSDLDAERFLPEDPLSWLGEVEQVFMEAWEERAAQAEEAGKRPRPFSTGEVRAEFRRCYPGHEKLDDPQLLVNALKQLSRGMRPAVQAIRREQSRHLLWAPVEANSEELDIAGSFAKDSERVEEGVRRAVERLGRPVTQIEVWNEIEVDLDLRPASKQPFHLLLQDVARRTVPDAHGGQASRRKQRVFRTGEVGGTVYYSVQDGPEEKAWIRLRSAEQAWEDGRWGQRLTSLSGVPLAEARAGRARLLRKEISPVLRAMREAVEGPLPCESHRLRGRKTLGHVEDFLTELTGWISGGEDLEDRSLPPEATDISWGWTAEDVIAKVGDIYPAANRADDVKELIPLLSREIRRIPNPNYVSRSASDPHAAASLLFDPVAVALMAARRWGGPQASIAGSAARSVLGNLRDPRFVLPGLDRDEVDVRYTTIATLAFLPDEAVLQALAEVAATDPEDALRELAGWGYCLASAIGEGRGEAGVGNEPPAMDRFRGRSFSELIQV
jgi:hypothetical protein